MTKSPKLLAQVIGAIALDLHASRSDDLLANLPAECQWVDSEFDADDYVIDKHAVRFKSIDARNRVVAAHMFNDKIDALSSDPEGWLEVAHDLWRHQTRADDSAAGRLLGLVHESDDIFQLAAAAIEKNPRRVFEILHVIEPALEYLDALPVDGLFRLAEVELEHTKNDLAGGMWLSELEKALIDKPDVCIEIRQRVIDHPSEPPTGLYAVAVVAFANSNHTEAAALALEDTKSANESISKSALRTLGSLLLHHLVTDELEQTVCNTLLEGIASSNLATRQAATQSAARAIQVTDAFDNLLLQLAQEGDQYTLAVIANMLFMNRKQLQERPIFKDWVHALSKLSPEFGGALQNYDYTLSELTKNPSYEEFAITCLTNWILANSELIQAGESAAELFTNTVIELGNHPELLSQVITDWLHAESMQLGAAAAELLTELSLRGLHNVEFKVDRLDAWSKDDFLYLIRRMLGFLSQEGVLLPLTMSLLKTRDAKHRSYGFVYTLLVDHLGKDYPDSTLETIEASLRSAKDEELIAFMEKAKGAIEQRFNVLDGLPRLQELQPPSALRLAFAKARAKQMSRAFDKAQENSIVKMIATEVPIKAGTGWFSFRDGAYTEINQMHAHSRSVSLPRSEILDSVGSEIDRLMYRNTKRGES